MSQGPELEQRLSQGPELGLRLSQGPELGLQSSQGSARVPGSLRVQELGPGLQSALRLEPQ